jgi:predicted TIM-barrel fold metal-dependent hydrolase
MGDVYRLISADAHVNEPPELWTSRVSQKFRDRVPRMEHFDEGDAWIVEGCPDPITFGFNACAGLEPSRQKSWARFDEIRAGGYDPTVRLQEMDTDGVDAEVLYASPRLSGAVAVSPDPELHHAMVAGYNDWLSEYVQVAPRRFGGIALLPNRGSEGAIAEIERVWGRPGIRGFVMTAYPNGSLQIEGEDDKVWAVLSERRIPLSIHVSLTQSFPSLQGHQAPIPGANRFSDAPTRIMQLIFAGIFDRYPDLQVVIAEVDSGWVPYFKEQMDQNFLRLAMARDFSIRDLPSRYVDRHFSTTFITDPVGVRLRNDVGVDRMMWSSDYPHIGADWPHSWRSIGNAFSGVPLAEQELMLAGNAARLYGFVSS